MRINVYTEELTDEVDLVSKVAETGIEYFGARLLLASPNVLHHTPQDDDRSAITLWIPWSKKTGHDGIYVAEILEELAEKCRQIQGHLPVEKEDG